MALAHSHSTNICTGVKRQTLVAHAKRTRSRVPSVESTETELPEDKYAEKYKQPPASREAVLKSCFVTSGGMAVAGLGTRQLSHFLADSGWLSSSDCTALIPFDFLTWHSGATVGMVALVSVLRLLFLKVWPDFAFSSQAANEKVLSSLEPLDYVSVAFASGLSEELLFRGAVLPLLGMDTKAVLVSGTIFGALHLTGGRNVAFAIWASLVGILYGAASVWTSDLYVPMLSHSLANLAAALFWKYSNDK